MVKELRPLTLKSDTHKDRLRSLVTLGIATVPLFDPSTLDKSKTDDEWAYEVKKQVYELVQ